MVSAALMVTVAMASMKTETLLKPVAFEQIAGWEADSVERAFSAFRRSCAEILDSGRSFARAARLGGERSDWIEPCKIAEHLRHPPVASEARDFFQRNFRAFRVTDPLRSEGLFTGYFEPEVDGSLIRTQKYTVPLYAKPPDLVAFDSATEQKSGLRYGRIVAGEPAAYFSRREIETGSLKGQSLEIVWLASSAEAFFIHIQGSGRVRLPDGRVLRLAYSAKNGLPYTGVGGLLSMRGELPASDVSMQSIRAWMARHPLKARELMWENKSFVFFRVVQVDGQDLGPPGAQKVNLTPHRSIAVDRDIWALGTPLWIDTEIPSGRGTEVMAFRHLLIAQDTGSAIKGVVRGDIFFGAGEDAAWKAGHLKGNGSMIALLPSRLAERLAPGD